MMATNRRMSGRSARQVVVLQNAAVLDELCRGNGTVDDIASVGYSNRCRHRLGIARGVGLGGWNAAEGAPGAFAPNNCRIFGIILRIPEVGNGGRSYQFANPGGRR